MRLILLAPTILLIGATPQKHAQVPEAIPAGKPVNCISTSNIRQTHVRSDRVIDFEMGGGKYYRNELPRACPTLGFEKRFIHKGVLNQYCSVDTITVFTDPPMGGPTCGLGTFQPVTLVKKH